MSKRGYGVGGGAGAVEEAVATAEGDDNTYEEIVRVRGAGRSGILRRGGGERGGLDEALRFFVWERCGGVQEMVLSIEVDDGTYEEIVRAGGMKR